jgi:hypothetical protein
MLPMSPITRTIIDLLKSRMNDQDSLITHAELQQATGMSLLAIRHFFYTARKRIRDDHGKWFECYRGVGYKVVLDEDLPGCAKANRRKTRNLNRESLKILAIADPAKQSAIAQRHTMLERSVAELGMMTTSQRSIAKIEQTVARTHNQPLSAEQQVELIKDALVAKATTTTPRRAEPQSAERTETQAEAIKNALSRR